MDRRLRSGERRVHKHPFERMFGLPWYRYRWRPVAGRLYGLQGVSEGPRSGDVRRRWPRSVRRDRFGYDHVDWQKILRINEC